jgi:hypothetical protein
MQIAHLKRLSYPDERAAFRNSILKTYGMLLELGISMDYTYLKALVVDNTGKLRFCGVTDDLVFLGTLGAHVYGLPF